MKKKQDIIKDFVRELDDDQLRFLQARLSQRLSGDVGEAVEFLQGLQKVDEWLRLAVNNAEFMAKIDHIEALIQGEVKKRSVVLRIGSNESSQKEKAS